MLVHFKDQSEMYALEPRSTGKHLLLTGWNEEDVGQPSSPGTLRFSATQREQTPCLLIERKSR